MSVMEGFESMTWSLIPMICAVRVAIIHAAGRGCLLRSIGCRVAGYKTTSLALIGKITMLLCADEGRTECVHEEKPISSPK